jgi:hypothetical protein
MGIEEIRRHRMIAQTNRLLLLLRTETRAAPSRQIEPELLNRGDRVVHDALALAVGLDDVADPAQIIRQR